LMEYHDQLGHISFEQLKVLVQQGFIPKKLLHCPTPKCPGCLYGKAHKRPWRSKQQPKTLKPATYPGEVVSVDQLESPVPGFVPTAKGRPTVQRYVGATVFADHFSDLTYVHLMKGLSGDETLEAKRAFEQYAEQHGVRIRHYHCDNGRFAEKTFMDDVTACQQTISFCGVGAHHMNGKAERRIRDLTEAARTMLLHAVHRWPKTVTVNLWPQALKHAVNIRNSLPRALGSSSPLSSFSQTNVQPNLKHFHPFGCPVYVLEGPLQTNAPFPKWNERSRVGIFLCHSPHHASSVPLVLNIKTGLVSPQFHVVFDDNFETITHNKYYPSLWQYKAQFSAAPDKEFP